MTKEGTVIPSKILNTSKEESFEVYENRFIYTLLLKVKDFIDRRSAAIKSAMMQSGELGVDVESEFSVDKSKVRYKMSGNANFPFDAVVKKSGGRRTVGYRAYRENKSDYFRLLGESVRERNAFLRVGQTAYTAYQRNFEKPGLQEGSRTVAVHRNQRKERL